MLVGKLTDKTIAAAQAGEKQYKISDGDGLSLIIQPNGKKLWWFRYRFAGKEKTLSLGVYPVLGLRDARERAFDARRLLSNGTDPSAIKREAQNAIKQADMLKGETVEAISREWFAKFGTQWADSHRGKIIRRLERDLFPWLGKEEIKGITPAILLSVLRRVEARGVLDTAHRLHQNCGQIWRYAVATGRAERDVTQDLRGALPPARGTHLGAITEPVEIGKLLRNIDDYKGSEVVRLALKLAPLVFVRPGELRQSVWAEFDLPARAWIIPAGRMKAKRPHLVPLSEQVVEILHELKTVSGEGEYLFPSPQSKTRCLSDMAFLSAIRRMGYEKNEMTAHGFRAMASTNLEQMGYDSRLIEIQLAHSDTDQVRAAYKRETHLLRFDERKKMMQHWADYLDGLRVGATVVKFKKAK